MKKSKRDAIKQMDEQNHDRNLKEENNSMSNLTEKINEVDKLGAMSDGRIEKLSDLLDYFTTINQTDKILKLWEKSMLLYQEELIEIRRLNNLR